MDGQNAAFVVKRTHPPPPCWSPAIERHARNAARSSGTVMLLGESGTGKTTLARCIHDWSGRAQGPFVRVDLAGVAPELIESELFGHTKGAFTGAIQARLGMARLAQGGTLFLDEISLLRSDTQRALLTLIEEHRVRPVGSDRWVDVDVRVVAATNEDLMRLVSVKSFRADLYYRCVRLAIVLPPIRERRGELPSLARKALWEALRELESTDLDELTVASGALEPLLTQRFPGNLRELQSICHAALLEVGGGVLEACHLEAALRTRRCIQAAPPAVEGSSGVTRYHREGGISDERRAIAEALKETEGNKRRAALRLGMSRGTLYRKLDEYRVREGS